MENATKSDNFYMGHPPGQYYRQLQAVAYTYEQGSMKAKVMVTEDTCNLVGEVIYDTGSTAGAKVINRLYVNQSMDANDEFFKVNPNITCVPDANPPAMSQWDYISLFGWLLGVQQN
nr:hypothetical protein BaRGS_002313 [Batillaria attramentaria]